MVSPREIRAGAAFIELYLKDRVSAGLTAAQRKLRAFGRAATDIGKQLLKVSAVMGSPFIAGAKVFADFDRQMAMVSTMLDEPEKHMERFRKGIREMAVEFGESTETLSKGLYDVLSALIPPEHAMTVLAAATKAAKAGLTDTQTAARAIITVLNSYGISADQAGKVSDLLFMIVRRGVTTFEELAPQMGRVAATASAAGAGLDELGAVLATITRAGVQTEHAVVAVNQIMMRFLKPTAEAVEVAKELGFEMSAATLKSEGLMGVFKRISQLPPDVIAKLFPNVRALRGVIPALKNIEGLEKDVEMMRNSAGATETAYKKMTGTLAHAFDRAKQAAVDVLRSIGEAISEPLSKVSAGLVKYAKLIADFVSRNKAAALAVAKVVLMIGAAGAALLSIGIGAKILAAALGGLASIVSGAATVVGLLGSVLGALLSPIGLVIAGVVALGATILYATGAGAKAIGWLGERFNQLKADASAAWQGIADALAAGDIGLAAKILWLTLKMWWQKGVSWLLDIWYELKFTIIRVLTEAFYGALAALTTAWSSLQKAWVHATSFLLKVWNNFTAGVRSAWAISQNWLAKRFIELQGLLDDSLDVDAAKKGLDQTLSRELGKIGIELEAKEKEIDTGREKKLAGIREEESGTLAEIARKADEAKARQVNEYAETLRQSEAELAKAKQEWKDAIGTAAARRKEKEAGEPAPAEPSGLDELFKKLEGVSQAVETGAKKTVGVRGTFSALEARGLGAGGAAERTAKATEEVAENTKKLLDEAEDGGLVFA